MEKEQLKRLNFKEILKGIEALFFDIDGVLSSSQIVVMENGSLYRTTNVKDGYILKYALKQGIKIFIISGGLNTDIQKRFHKLGIDKVVIGCSNKIDEFEKFVKDYNLNPDKILYMGDDIPDYPVMKRVGLPCCPADAVSEIKEISMYVSDKNGGQGCVRDIVEQVLRAQGKWLQNSDFST